MTSHPRHPLRCEDGFSLAELVVAMTLSLIVLFAVLGAFDAFNSGVAANNRLTAAEDTARREVATMVRILRDAGAPAPASGSQPTTVVQAGANDIVFLSTSWPGESGTGATGNHVERLCVDTATRTLWFNGLRAGTAGSASPGSACPSQASGWTSRLIARDVVNTAAQPIFRYGSSSPVRTVSISLRLEGGTAATSRPLELRSGSALRGALAPQVGPDDVTVGPCEAGKALLTLNLAAGGTSTNGAKVTASNAVTVGPGKILVDATSTPATVALTVTNVLGLQTVVLKSVSC